MGARDGFDGRRRAEGAPRGLPVNPDGTVARRGARPGRRVAPPAREHPGAQVQAPQRRGLPALGPAGQGKGRRGCRRARRDGAGEAQEASRGARADRGGVPALWHVRLRGALQAGARPKGEGGEGGRRAHDARGDGHGAPLRALPRQEPQAARSL